MKKFKYFETNDGKTLMSAKTVVNKKEVTVTVNAEGILDISTEDDVQVDKDLFLVANTFTYTDPVTGDECELVEEVEEETKEPVIGKFKLNKPVKAFFRMKRKFRIHSEYAFIEASEFSGTFEEGVKMKLTICSENTANFEEVDTNLIDDAMAQRFLDDLVDQKSVLWNGKCTLPKYKFTDDKDNRIYPEVEEVKPIDKLKNLFDEDDKTKVSKKGMSFLDSLLSNTDKDESEESEDDGTSEGDAEFEAKQETKEPVDLAQQMMKESFIKMNKEKVEELEARVTLKERDIMKYTNDAKRAEKLKDQVLEDVRILTTRLESLKPKNEPNGFVFFVGAENKAPEVDEEATKEILSKIAPHLKLKEEALLEIFKKSYYQIYLAPKEDINSKELTREILNSVSHLDPSGKVSFLKDNELEYRGEYNWHRIVDRMIKLGFEQDAEFDKLCGSNSYYSKSLGTSDETVETDEDNDSGVMIIENGVARKMKGDSLVLGEDANGNMSVQETNTMSNTNTSKPATVKTVTEPSGADITKYSTDNGDLFVKSKKPEIEEFKDKYDFQDEETMYDMQYELVDAVPNWPEVSSLESPEDVPGQTTGSYSFFNDYMPFEPQDLENCEWDSISKDKIVISGGGDWQEPLSVTIQCDTDGNLFVTQIEIGYGGGCSTSDFQKAFSLAVMRDEKIDTVLEK